MWPFLGFDHFVFESTINNYWKDVYNSNFNKIKMFFNPDIYMWKKKERLSKKKSFNIIVPSLKLYNYVKNNSIYKNFKINLIKTPINEKVFFNQNNFKFSLRKKYKFKNDNIIVMFSSIGGIGDLRKNWKFILSTLNNDFYFNYNFTFLVLGGNEKKNFYINNINFNFLGTFNDEKILSELYNCCDLVAIPSLVDNLPQVGLEAQMCGIPVLTFDIEGLNEIVEHKKTGYLAKYMNEESFILGLKWIIKNNQNKIFNKNIARQAFNTLSFNKTSNFLNQYYEKIYNE